MKNSVLFPILVETGKYIMKIDPIEASDEINKTIDTTTEKLKKSIQENVTKELNATVTKKIENVQQTLKQEK